MATPVNINLFSDWSADQMGQWKEHQATVEADLL